MNKLHSLKWFMDRIGKRIYRDATSCSCRGCGDTIEKGLIIGDEKHAEYLYNTQNDYATEGEFLNYRDKK